MSEQQSGGVDVDPVESRIYTGNKGTKCARCGKSLNKQACYMLNDGKFVCYDESTDVKAFDAIVCRVIQSVRLILNEHGIHLSEKMAKQLEKLIRDQK